MQSLANNMIDMHMHSTASDGLFKPSLLAFECKKAGISLAALTDHDTIDGVGEFLAAAKELKMPAISGVEFSVEYPGEMHMLGYGFDIENRELNEVLTGLKAERKNRARRMVDNLRAQGYNIELSKVQELAGGGSVGRPHVARALFEAGYAPDPAKAFDMFMLPGKPGYLERDRIRPEAAIDLIHRAGGKAVLAHPRTVKTDDLPKLIAELARNGLDGVEAVYSSHSPEEAKKLIKICIRLGLMATAGSDYHGMKEVRNTLGMDISLYSGLRESICQNFGLNG